VNPYATRSQTEINPEQRWVQLKALKECMTKTVQQP
jgi:hypothetical protein